MPAFNSNSLVLIKYHVINFLILSIYIFNDIFTPKNIQDRKKRKNNKILS